MSETKVIYNYKNIQIKLVFLHDNKSKTKVQKSPNTTFANIKDIIKAHKEKQEKVEFARKQAIVY